MEIKLQINNNNNNNNNNRENQSVLIAAQNNAIDTNPIKARTDKKQRNCKRRLCCDRDEIINHIISECSKLALEMYNRHNWISKVIHFELCKKF